MKKPILFLLGVGFALFLGACGKDEENGSKTDNLTSGKWKLSSSVAKFTFNGIEQTVDVYAQLAACEKDNEVEFKADGTLIDDEGALKCDPADPQQEVGTWALTQNDTHLTVSGTDGDFDAEIVELTGSTLKVTYDTDLSGIVTSTVTVFTKI